MTADVLPFTPRGHAHVYDRPGDAWLAPRPRCRVYRFQPRGKPVLATIMEALLALSLDKLGTVHRRKDKVFVMTNRGAGWFPADAWDAHVKERLSR